MKIILIAAHDKNRLIGNGEKIPWYIPEDFQHFKKTTLGCPIVMGRKTFESIGRPLPKRKNIVLSRGNFETEGVEVFHEKEKILESLKNEEKIFIIWGAQIYKLFLEDADEIIISEIPGDFEGDIYFPEYKHIFEEFSREKKEGFEVVNYRRK